MTGSEQLRRRLIALVRSYGVAAIFLWGVLPGLASAQDTPAGIRATLDSLETAYRTGDTALLMSMVTDDATLLPPGGRPLIGREALEARYTAMFKRGHIELTMTATEVRMGSGWALVEGKTLGQAVREGEESGEAVAGKFMMVLERRDDGAWRMARLIWNDDK